MGRKKWARLTTTALMGVLMLVPGLASPGPASAMATVSALSSPNITSPYSGNLATIQISDISVSPGQSDDILVSLPGGITLAPYHAGQAFDNYVSIPQYNPGTTVQNVFWAGAGNGDSVVENAYVTNPVVSVDLISFWITPSPASSAFSGMGSIDVMLPVISVSGAKPGPINVSVRDTDNLIADTVVSTSNLVSGAGVQLGFIMASLPVATVGQLYDVGIATNRGGEPPYTFTVGSGQLPPGIALSPSGGVLTGTPSTAGTYYLTISVQDSLGFTVSDTFPLIVNPAAPPVSNKPSTSALNFSDIGNSWAKSYILKLAGAGVVSGYPDDTFRPDATVTRVEFAKMLLTAMGVKPVQDTSVLRRYSDYGSFASWELPWLAAAVDNNLLSGYPDATLKPDQTVTRLEAAVIMGRTITRMTPTPLTFADSDAIPAWAANYVGLDLTQAKGRGLFGTIPQGHFGPDQNLTRAGAAAGVAVYLNL